MKLISFLLFILMSTAVFASGKSLTEDEYDVILRDNNISAIEKLKKDGLNLNQEINGNSLLNIAIDRRKKAVAEWLILNKAELNKPDSNGKTPLMTALNELSSSLPEITELAELILSSGADVNIKDENGRNALLKISNESYDKAFIKIYDTVIKSVKDINLQDERGNTALMNSVEYGNSVLAEKILSRNPDVTLKNTYNRDALYLLSRSSRASTDIAEKLIKAGCSLNGTPGEDNSPLIASIKYYSKDNHVIEILLKHNADIDFTDNDGNYPLHVACRVNEIPAEIIRKLIIPGKNLNVIAGYDKNTAAHMIVSQYSFNKSHLAEVIKAGADLNIRNNYGETVLISAVKNHYADDGSIALILKSSAKINEADGEGNTALHWAVKQRNLRYINILLSHNADVNAVDFMGETPLHRAAEAYYYEDEGLNEIFSALLARNASVNAVNKYGETPLILCYKNSNASGAQILIAHGADYTVTDNSQNSIFHYAAAGDNIDLFSIIENKNLIINSQNSSGNTPLHIAFSDSQFNNAEYLMKNGANPLITNNKDQTALDIAIEAPHQKNVFRISENSFLDEYFRSDAGFSGTYLAALDAAAQEQKAYERGEKVDAVKKFLYLTVPPAVFLGSSIYLREVTYSDRPQDNNFTYLNSTLTCTFTGMVAGGFLGVLCTPKGRDGWGKLAGFFFGGVAGTAAGLVTGILTVDQFNNNDVLYYSAPVSLAIVMPIMAFQF